MWSNSLGKSFVITTFGESHGRVIGVTIDGCPAGLRIEEGYIQADLDKRRPGLYETMSPRDEADKVHILSGVFRGFSTGAPITMIIKNLDVDSSVYEAIKETPRPGHADYTAWVKYGGFNDYRGGGRFSGRITASIVMAGSIAKRLLKEALGIEILAHTVQLGTVKVDRELSLEEIRNNVYSNPVRCADPSMAKEMEAALRYVMERGDSLGGVVECISINVPAGLGEPIFDALDSDIAKAIFSIPGVRGVEFGSGFRSAIMRGSEHNDPFIIKDGRVLTTTNNAGGIVGGISNGMPIVFRVAFKPTPSIAMEQRTVNLRTGEGVNLRFIGRHDPSIVPRAVPVVEASTALVLADHALRSGFIPKVIKDEGRSI
ncbi:MAG: chorismate synthase [Candidatus Bathyarchaeia archaeon]